MDLGSELGQNEEIKNLLMKHGDEIQPTAPDAFHQNPPAERPHETIGDTIQSMLEGTDLLETFLSHVLYH
eukprot:12115315-Ditylum_brightwellii.AAC.1